jgi:hypothetical protein
MSDRDAKIAALRAELDALQATQGAGGVLTATTMGGDIPALRIYDGSQDTKKMTPEQKAAQEREKYFEEVNKEHADSLIQAAKEAAKANEAAAKEAAKEADEAQEAHDAAVAEAQKQAQETAANAAALAGTAYPTKATGSKSKA